MMMYVFSDLKTVCPVSPGAQCGPLSILPKINIKHPQVYLLPFNAFKSLEKQI
jgi:hypothetical protein